MCTRPRPHALAALVLVLGCALAACGGGTPAATRGAPGAFPLTLTVGSAKVRIAHRPTRILSLSASATEMLYAIGAGSQVVGVDTYSTWPKSAPRTSFTGAETSAEAYLKLRPDLVVLAYDSSHLVAQLHALGVPALVLGPAVDLAGSEAEMRLLGTATGHVAAAAQAISAMASTLEHIAAPLGAAAKGATFYLELDPTYYSATSATFVGSLFHRLGMTDIADRAAKAAAGYPQLSAEYLLSADPDYVFLADIACCGQSARTFGARAALSGLSALHDGRVFTVDDSLASEWGPHSMEQLLQLLVTDLRAHPLSRQR
jgi:iron complex transport system substrate-binding protein